MFLSETHLDSYPAECLRRRLKMDQKLVCTSNGRSGGLLLLWKNNIVVHRLGLDPKFIDVQITSDGGEPWRLTGMYGEFRWENKYLTWDRMRQLSQTSTLPWLLIGDLNEIQFLHEKEGGIHIPNSIWWLSNKRLMIVTCMIWASLEIYLHGTEEGFEEGWTEVS